ncbi:MAG: hypothetical protein JNM17_12210 [Archangium sp.]|nr:hypothetical protein [Archangium sp.]
MKRRILIGLDLFTAIGAFFGGIAMLSDPHGAPIGMTQDLLAHTPFPDYRAPGALLILCNGLLPLVTVVLVLRKSPWAVGAQLATGIMLMGWMGGQLAMIGFGAPIQVVMLIVGALILRFTFDEAQPMRVPVS